MIPILAHKLSTTLIENKELLAKSSLTIFAATFANLETIGGTARHISAIIAVFVGILTVIKLIRDLFFNKKKNNESSDNITIN